MDTGTPPPINYSIQDFCRAHGISRSLVYELIARGQIRPIKVGKRALIPRREAERWQLERERAAGLHT